jgi:dihydropteroate synthase
LINAGGKLLNIRNPLVMGIVNITPDSFYAQSRHSADREVLSSVAEMIEEGADIIDIGGLSTRPGATVIPEEEERSRLLMSLRLLRREFPGAVLSIDTFRASIAREAYFEAGIDIINDISGGTLDPEMISLVKEINIPYVMMHIPGGGGNMHEIPEYSDVVPDIIGWFSRKISPLLEAGVKDIIIDPGIGFGKTIDQNYVIIDRLKEFNVIGLPVLVGLSRKSLVWKTLNIDPSGALNGTTALNMAALINGADILRVHDVKEAVETVRLFEKIRESRDYRR